MTWTPGPWRIGDAGRTVFGPPSDHPAPVVIAEKLPPTPRVSASERAANARLISLAPELAEALRHTLARLAAETKDVECCDLYPSTVAAMNEARALLAKLEGGGK